MTEGSAPGAIEIREQLDRLRCSRSFVRSTSLFAFLQYIVEEALAARSTTLKELVIGDALYGRHAPYDPRIDSAVRVEARRLRRKLEEYYAGPGLADAVHIALPTGGYQPVFSRRCCEIADLESAPGSAGVDLAVMPFRTLSPCGSDNNFADGLTDEVIFAFGEVRGLRVAPRLVVFQYKDRTFSLAEAARDMSVSAVLHGTIRSEAGRSRVTVEVSDSLGYVTWSERFDCEFDECFRRQEELAQAIVHRTPVRICVPQEARLA